MSDTFLDHVARTLEGIEADGMMKRERLITSPQGGEIRVGDAQVLNLCANNYLGLADHPALIAAAKHGDMSGVDGYSDLALKRIWNAMRFSWQMTKLLHRFDDDDSFAEAMRKSALNHLANSETARRDLAENYVGLPY